MAPSRCQGIIKYPVDMFMTSAPCIILQSLCFMLLLLNRLWVRYLSKLDEHEPICCGLVADWPYHSCNMQWTSFQLMSSKGTFSMNYICVNSLAPWRFQTNFRKAIFQLILAIDGWSVSCKIVLKWMPMHLADGKSTLVQVMAWCRQATSHCLNQCWPRSLLPYGVIRPQCVNQHDQASLRALSMHTVTAHSISVPLSTGWSAVPILFWM